MGGKSLVKGRGGQITSSTVREGCDIVGRATPTGRRSEHGQEGMGGCRRQYHHTIRYFCTRSHLLTLAALPEVPHILVSMAGNVLGRAGALIHVQVPAISAGLGGGWQGNQARFRDSYIPSTSSLLCDFGVWNFAGKTPANTRISHCNFE
ncbi:hypothetical protein SK128_027481, partial [Halocaridina rubra]